MDKATYVFEKYAAAGWWKNFGTKLKGLGESLLSSGKKELGKSKGYIQKEFKGEIQPLTNMKKTQISSMNDFVKARGPINSSSMQGQLENTLNKTLWTGGKRPVSVMNKEELAKAVARERYMRKMGL